MAAEKQRLVIVESPSKAKTIGKYLGSEYLVKASMGHLRDLPKSTMGVDIANDFEPEYVPIDNKSELIQELRSMADKSSFVYLATDPDREGEAISWHLKELLELPDDKTRRVTFNEITKNVVTKAIEQPRAIDQGLVDAQQARRILDRIVGYQLSPLLWKKVRRGLSAGRVQSVATRMVVERENEIRAFVAEEYWTVDATVSCIDKEGSFVANYYGDSKKRTLRTQEQADAVIADVSKMPFVVTGIKRADKNRLPSPPFITSTLQQEASRKLNMTPKRTMSIAQQLYEGIDIAGQGMTGLITYMRTDSQRLSEEALFAAKEFITAHYGSQYYPKSPRRYKSKSNAQDAHEAIRPTNVFLTPESIEKSLTKEQLRLYKLIWSRFVACQMAAAVYDTVSIEIESAGHSFHSNHHSVKFPGFLAVYEDGHEEDVASSVDVLPALTEGEKLKLVNTKKEQHFTQPPARYTEATLVKAMEEKGVGRPSTYATIISTIQEREYVVKTDKRLAPTKLGEVVTQLMIDRFNDVIDVEFTADMETKLDNVEAGKLHYKKVLSDFYNGFHQQMLAAEDALKDTRIKVPDEETEEICELCGRNMVVKIGKFGKFLACPGFPQCQNTKPIVEKMPGRCPKCGSGIFKRKSKKGYPYYACENGAACGFMSWDVPTDKECSACGDTLFKKAGRGRNTPFCINEKCTNFLPEDKRGYRRRTTDQTQDNTKKKSTGKKSAKTASSKKSSAMRKNG